MCRIYEQRFCPISCIVYNGAYGTDQAMLFVRCCNFNTLYSTVAAANVTPRLYLFITCTYVVCQLITNTILT